LIGRIGIAVDLQQGRPACCLSPHRPSLHLAGEYPELGDGEASTLALALERNGALVLMDDAAGRECAAALGLQVLGLAEL
jgi:hypothetical protein